MFAVKITGWFTGMTFEVGSFDTRKEAEDVIVRIKGSHSANKHTVVELAA